MGASISNLQLADLTRQMSEASSRVRKFLGVDDAVFGRPPKEQAWSAAQCVRHLSLTTEAYLTILDEALLKPDKQKVSADHRYRPDFIGRALTWLLEPPFRTKTKTAPSFVPLTVGGKAVVIAEFEQLQQALMARVTRCEGRDLEHMRVVSPFNASAKYNLYSALTILMAHQRRHLWQADRALEAASQGA